MADHPYKSLPAEAFWKTGVAEAGFFGLADLWHSKFSFDNPPSFATYGSCFAQHFSREVRARGLVWADGEPAPPLTPPGVLREFNYGVFSARTANIYTAPQFDSWISLARDPEACETVELWCTAQDGAIACAR